LDSLNKSCFTEPIVINSNWSSSKARIEAHVAIYEDQMKYLRERLVAMEENFSNTIQAMRERNFIEAKNAMNHQEKS